MKNAELHFRFAREEDLDLYFRWANDPVVRQNSYSINQVIYENHVKWFKEKILNPDYYFYLFLNASEHPVGQVRIVKGDETIIGISIDENFRGQALGSKMLEIACEDFLSKNPASTIVAYIKKENAPSLFAFRKAGFRNEELVIEQGSESYKLYKNLING
ncbi:MAG: Acyl-CoA N-acyltransferase [Bacteroidota bacterium]|jgi:RimJ/RimL family protein N-acetyltransferase|nr:Acyl-CoA N-acyltransferase [Bacteroidota bacterium]